MTGCRGSLVHVVLLCTVHGTRTAVGIYPYRYAREKRRSRTPEAEGHSRSASSRMDGRCRCDAWHMDTVVCQGPRTGNGIRGALCGPCSARARVTAKTKDRDAGLKLDKRYVLLAREPPAELAKAVRKKGSFDSTLGWKVWQGTRLVTAYLATGGLHSKVRSLRADRKPSACMILILEKKPEECDELQRYSSRFERFSDRVELRVFTASTADDALFLDVHSPMRSEPVVESLSSMPPAQGLEQLTLPYVHQRSAGAAASDVDVGVDAAFVDSLLADVTSLTTTPSRGSKREGEADSSRKSLRLASR